MAAARNFLAFDLGAESGRAVLGKLDAGRLSLEEKHRFANPMGRINGHLHWNLLQQWEELKSGLRKTAAGGDVRLDGIGVDTWGVDFGLLGKNGDVLSYPYMYRDARTDGVMEKVFATVPREKVFEATGVQFMSLNTLYQLYAMRHDQKSPLLDCADKLLFMPDLFNYLFTGVARAEFSIASTSQFYDPRKKTWANNLLEALDLPMHVLPQIVQPGTILGDLRDDVAKECGAARVPVIAVGGHDTASAVAAVPAESAEGRGDWCYISSGTWSLMGVELREPVINQKSLALNYTNEGGVGGTIRFLKNIMGLWLVQECRRQWQREGKDFSYVELTRMAADAPSLQCVVPPDHTPFGSPGEMPRKIADYCKQSNQRVPSTPGEFVRACLDSLALAYRRTLDGLEDVLGRRMSVIHIVGGGTQNELLTQMAADACGRTVIAGPVEATAIGNILVQAMATGDVKSIADLRAIVRNSFEVKRYEPRETAKWDAAYERFKQLPA
jgi:rhamnulokinase